MRIPYYDFKTGKSHPDHTPMHLEEHEIVLIDSLHGLHPEMTADIDDSLKFKLYIEPPAATQRQPGGALCALDGYSPYAPNVARCQL